MATATASGAKNKNKLLKAPGAKQIEKTPGALSCSVLSPLDRLPPLRGSGPSLLNPLASSFSGLHPLRGSGAPLRAPLSRPAHHSPGIVGGQEAQKTSTRYLKGSNTPSVLECRKEERAFLNMPDFKIKGTEDKISETKVDCHGSYRPDKTVCFAEDRLGGILQHGNNEDSDLDPEVQDSAMSWDESSEPRSQQDNSQDNWDLEEDSFSVDMKLSKKDVDMEKSKKEELKTNTDKRNVQAKIKDEPLVHDVLDEYYSWLSDSSDAESIAQGWDEPPSRQGPENSRGRQVCTSNIQLKGADVRVKNGATINLKEIKKTEKKKDVEKRNEEEKDRVKSEQELEGVRERLLKEKESKIQLLQQKLRREEEQEERRLKEQTEERLRTLQQHLLSMRTQEEARLRRESDQKLEELKESAKREREEQEHLIREESQARLKEFQVSIEEELAAARSQLEKEKRRDLQRLKEESKKELQAEKRRLQREREDKVNIIEERLRTLQQHLLSVSTQEEARLRRESNQKLEELKQSAKKEREEQEHLIREETQARLKEVRVSLEEELTAACSQMQKESRDLQCLKEESESPSHPAAPPLTPLRTESEDKVNSIKQEVKSTERRKELKESDLKDLADQLELRAKELERKEALLHTKAADLRRRQKLGEEEQEVDGKIEDLPRLIKESDQLKEALTEDEAWVQKLVQERKEARKQVMRLKAERDKAREESRRAQEEKERLQSKVALLQRRRDHLNLRFSELDHDAVATEHHPAALDKALGLCEQISSQLTHLAGALESLAHGQGDINHLTSPPPVTHSQLPQAWLPRRDSTSQSLFGTPISSDNLVNSRWSRTFPGVPIDKVTSSPAHSSYWSRKKYLLSDI